VLVHPEKDRRSALETPQSAVGADLDKALDVHRDFLAEIAFHRALFFQNLADAIHVVFAEIADLLVEIDPSPVQQGTRTGTANAVNVSQSDLGPLRGRQIYAGNTCHGSTF